MFAAALKKLSFTRQVEASRADHIFLVRGRDASGQRAWYYLLVDKGKRDMFRSREGVPYLKLTDYGEILFSGFGEEPPADIKQQMKDEYGFEE